MIDIIIPVYNNSKKLLRALSSLASQTSDRFKTIIIDDCSSEDLTPVIDRFKDILDITYIRNNSNIGTGASRQIGIDNSTSDYFVFLDSDDVLLPFAMDEIEEIISEAKPELVFSPFYITNKISGKFALIKHNEGFTWCHGKVYNREVFNKYEICNNPEYSRWADDSYLNAQCLELMEITMCKVPWYVWVQNNESLTHTTELNREEKDLILLKAMLESGRKVLQYKDNVTHINATINNLLKQIPFEKRSKEQQSLILKLNELNKIRE